jgi:glycosyltransferase involved in cell wall biosynthesis
MSMTVDVVIPTRDRPGRLANLLDDLRGQTRVPRTVIIVDDSLEPIDWSERYPQLSLRFVRPTGRAYISHSKNLGWTSGEADFVAFIDDDNRLPADLLAGLCRDLEDHPRWGAVMPGVLYRRRPDLVWVYAAPFHPNRWTFDLVGRNARRDPVVESHAIATDALPNLSVVRREVLQQVGGFDERFPINSSADFCQRVKQAGWEVWADPRILTEHDVEPPGVPGYWAEHTLADADRLRLEVADWVRFQRRWNGSGSFFSVRAGYHALGFLAPHFVALGARNPSRVLEHAGAAAAGAREGLSTQFKGDPITARVSPAGG